MARERVNLGITVTQTRFAVLRPVKEPDCTRYTVRKTGSSTVLLDAE
jgi:hypothetical protein